MGGGEREGEGERIKQKVGGVEMEGQVGEREREKENRKKSMRMSVRVSVRMRVRVTGRRRGG